MNVLFLSIDFVFPPDRGLRVRALSQLRVLASIEGVRSIRFVSLSDEEVGADRLRALEAAVPKLRADPPIFQPTHMRRSPRYLPRLLWLRALGIPYLAAKCDNARLHAELQRHLASGEFDVIYLGHLGLGTYLESVRRLAPNARVVLEEHNVEWEIFERLAPSFRPPLREAARWEARVLRGYEREILRAVDSVIAISDADAEALRRLADVDALMVPTYIEPAPARVETTRSPSLAYTGLLAWQPNAQGLDWFCASVWPLVRARVPEATLTIAGPGLRRGLDGALAVPDAWKGRGIDTVGYVEHLEDLYTRSLVMIAPIVGGSGVRMKLLESMRAGMPTVTTRDGAAGLAVEDGREMFIADDPARFADAIASLLSDGALRERMRSAGYAYLEAHHSLRAAGDRLKQALARDA